MAVNQPSSAARTNIGGDTFDELAQESSRIVGDARDLGRRALSTAGDAVEGLREQGSAVLEAGRKRAVKAKGRFDDLVSDNPTKSVLIAIGVGALLGFTLGRMRR